MSHLPRMVPPKSERSPWPPIDYKEELTVTSGDNWWSLQAKYGRPDVWDIIVYNFNTRDADETNWYLHHKLGCTLVTPDRNNFRFGFGDPKNPTREVSPPPGKSIKLYVPHDKWSPSTSVDDKLREEVVRTLRNVSGLTVRVGSVVVTGQDFGDIADKVATNQISVRHNPGLSVNAAYTSKAKFGFPPNTFEFKSAFPSSLEERALIVHEAVHAAMDVHKRMISAADNEGLAYVAQSLAILRRVGPAAGPLTTGEHGGVMDDKILEIAWNIAITLDGGGEPLEDDLKLLKDAIELHPIYSRKPWTAYDGI